MTNVGHKWIKEFRIISTQTCEKTTHTYVHMAKSTLNFDKAIKFIKKNEEKHIKEEKLFVTALELLAENKTGLQYT